MIDLKAIQPVDESKIIDALKANKALRREKAIRKFSLLCDKEREKLFNLISNKFPPFEMHLHAQNMSKVDFLGATSTFFGSFIFDLAIDVSDSIKQDFERYTEVKELVTPILPKKTIDEINDYEERRYVN